MKKSLNKSYAMPHGILLEDAYKDRTKQKLMIIGVTLIFLFVSVLYY